MRTFRLAAIAVALATFVSPLRADNPGLSSLRTMGGNGRIGSSVYLSSYQAVLGNAPGMPAIDIFSVNYLNHSYVSWTGMSPMGGALERYRMTALLTDPFAQTVSTSLLRTGDARSAGYLRRGEPRVRPKPSVPGGKKDVMTTTPEPEAVFLMGTGLLVLLAFARSRGNA